MPPSPPRLHRATVSRADLLRLLQRPGLDASVAAALCGFEVEVVTLPPSRPTAAAAVSTEPQPAALAEPVPAAEPIGWDWPPQAQHIAITIVKSSDSARDTSWLDEGEVYDALPVADPTIDAPMSHPLVPRRRMAALVRRCLRRPAPSRLPDVERWIDLTSRGRPWPARMPHRQLPRWGGATALVVDGGGIAAEPLRAELLRLVRDTLVWSGGVAQVFWLDDDGEILRVRGTARGQRIRWQHVPPAAVPAHRHCLWAAPGNAPVSAAWRARWATALDAHGSVTWLCAGALQASRADLPAGLQCTWWDVNASLHLRRPPANPPELPAENVERLVAAMSLAVRVEPALLRALRLCLDLPIDAEVAAWAHPDIRRHGVACDLAPERVADWRTAAVERLDLTLRRDLATKIAACHRHLSPLIQAEEAAIAADLAPGAEDVERLACWDTVARTLKNNPASPLGGYVARLAERCHHKLLQRRGIGAAWAIGHRSSLAAGLPLPQGLPAAAVQVALGMDALSAQQAQPWSLVQRGLALWLVPGVFKLALFKLLSQPGGLALDHGAGAAWRPWPTQPICLAPDLGVGPLTIATLDTVVTAGLAPRPRWAHEWARDSRGLYAVTSRLGPLQGRIDAPVDEPMDPLHPPLPDRQVKWSSRPYQPSGRAALQLGVDKRFGLYGDLTVGRVTQRLRWIAPGEFWMGSALVERVRISDEEYRKLCSDEAPRHRVAITQGFWMADTACTQGLWIAVVGTSHFVADGDVRRPVENVSYTDVERFLERLQSLLPEGVQAGLPTEAEWEYACRAGTDTVFSFGDAVGHEQANVDRLDGFGLPAGRRGRRQTVPVGSLPANPWGLYEMHGNVLEWCADGLRRYPEAAGEGVVADPLGPVEVGKSARRAVRGGSCLDDARRARSARRNAINLHTYGHNAMGFRLILRSSWSGLPAPWGAALLTAPASMRTKSSHIQAQPTLAPQSQQPAPQFHSSEQIDSTTMQSNEQAVLSEVERFFRDLHAHPPAQSTSAAEEARDWIADWTGKPSKKA